MKQDIDAAELFEALKLASNHMACGEYSDHEAFVRAREKVFATVKKYQTFFEDLKCKSFTF